MNVFGNHAFKLSRNPLGIIALSFVLVYGIAGFIATSSNFQPNERYLIIWFLILFPVLVLAVFYRLVTHHHDKLYAPSDFSNEENFLRLIESRIEKSIDEAVKRLSGDICSISQDAIEKSERELKKSLRKLITNQNNK